MLLVALLVCWIIGGADPALTSVDWDRVSEVGR